MLSLKAQEHPWVSVDMIVPIKLNPEAVKRMYLVILDIAVRHGTVIPPEIPPKDIVEDVIRTLYQSSIDSGMFEDELEDAVREADFFMPGMGWFDWIP